MPGAGREGEAARDLAVARAGAWRRRGVSRDQEHRSGDGACWGGDRARRTPGAERRRQPPAAGVALALARPREQKSSRRECAHRTNGDGFFFTSDLVRLG